MKVLQLHATYRETGGEDAVVRSEAELLRAGGHEVVTWLAANPTGALPTAAALASSAWNARAARAVRELAERERPDVAHVHNTWFALSAAVVRALDRAGVPVVVTLHNYRMLCVNASLFRDGKPCLDCVGSHPWRGVAHRCYRDSALASAAAAGALAVNRALGTWERHVKLFLCLTEFARERFVEGGLDPERVVVKPNVVADPGPRAKPPSASGTVLFVGRLDALKGLGTLLDAWSSAAPDGLELVVVGEGPIRGELERRAVPGVRLLRHQPPEEVRRLMLGARALVFPTRLLEGPSLVVREAFAAGLPVLASRLGGIPEFVRPLGERWLVDADDPAAWASALCGLRGLDGLDEAGGRARRLYEERLTPEHGRRLLEDAYHAAGAGTGSAGLTGSASHRRPARSAGEEVVG
jgi:glycosyltransferase involved in cell wall biosynthesis